MIHISNFHVLNLYLKLSLQACGELPVSALLGDQMIHISNFHVLKLFLLACGELHVYLNVSWQG
jgi:hypothetical protein